MRPDCPCGRPANDLRSNRGRAAGGGFTLIEILVVVVIIGVISAGILLSVSLTGRDSELEKESTRLLTLVNYAREQAELQTREYGILLQEDGYQFVAYDVHRTLWRSVFEDEALRRPKDAKDKIPQVMIFSSGELTSFEVTMEREGGVRSVTLAQDDKGQVVAKPMVENKP
jgi:general secretion pathway protein H